MENSIFSNFAIFPWKLIGYYFIKSKQTLQFDRKSETLEFVIFFRENKVTS